MKIFVISFKGNVSEEVCNKLKSDVKHISLKSSERELVEFIASNNLSMYDYIFGLGEYTGRDRDSIRVEKRCNTKFRNKKYRDNKIEINYDFDYKAKHIKLADGIGNSYCNLLSLLILQKNPSVQYSFLHIPKTFDANLAVDIIDAQIMYKLKANL